MCAVREMVLVSVWAWVVGKREGAGALRKSKESKGRLIDDAGVALPRVPGLRRSSERAKHLVAFGMKHISWIRHATKTKRDFDSAVLPTRSFCQQHRFPL